MAMTSTLHQVQRMSEPEGFCPACGNLLGGHTLRERRECRGAGITAVPRAPEPVPPPPKPIVVPGDLREKARQARRLSDAKKPVPEDLKEAAREVRRLRWAQLTPEQRKKEKEKSGEARTQRVNRDGVVARAPRIHYPDPESHRSLCGLTQNQRLLTEERERVTCRICLGRSSGVQMNKTVASRVMDLALARLREAHREEFETLIGEEIARLLMNQESA